MKGVRVTGHDPIGQDQGGVYEGFHDNRTAVPDRTAVLDRTAAQDRKVCDELGGVDRRRCRVRWM